MDVSQIDTDKYTHIHFGFGTLSEYFKVMVGNDRTQFEFERFKLLRGVKRVLSIGGWDFSTNPDTYMIFRNAVLPANRYEAAQNIANFVNGNGLDGVDIDWEYPGATDTGPPPAEEGVGLNHVTFLFFLKGLLLDKRVSIAAPASYWHLRSFPMKTIAAFIDHVAYMTYDLHGQWDYASQWAVPGCPAGNCL